MPDNSYEFGDISLAEKGKIFICKVLLAGVIALSFYLLVSDGAVDLSANLISVSGILAATFGYINLLRVKSELMALFKPPYHYVGREFIIIATIAGTASFFV